MKQIKFTIENSKMNIPTLSLIDGNGKKLYIHSRFDPAKEASFFNNLLINSKFNFLIIFGLGLGYHLSRSKENLQKFSQIIIIDILPKIEYELKKSNCSWILQQQKIRIITGKNLTFFEEYFYKNLNFSKISGFSILEHPASVRAFPEYYQKIKTIINKITDQKAGNLATQKAFSNVYLQNTIKKLSEFDSFLPIKTLFNKYKNIPVIIISSAPSLDFYIDWIKKNQDNFLKIAVDSALPVLSSKKIIPDFVISIDPQPWINEHFYLSKKEKINLIMSISSWKIKLKQSNNFLSLNTHPLAQIIEHFFPDIIGSIDSKTGNVAGDALNLALKMGCNPILMTGLDFSFPDFNIYARGTAYQKRYNYIFNNRFLPVETYNANYIIKSSKSIKKESKMTRNSFLQYRILLEGFIKKIKNNKKIYHLTHKGFPLQNTIIINNIKNAEKIINNNTLNYSKILTELLANVNFIGNQIKKRKIIEILSSPEIINNIIENSFDTKIVESKKKKKIQYIHNYLNNLKI